MSIYTRTGDDGTTALFGGRRVLKCEELVDVYGSVDEVNSLIGVFLTDIEDSEMRAGLLSFQSDLFTIGSCLAGWKADLTILEKRVDDMEKQIDKYEKTLPQIKNFILPGGTRAASWAHLIRSIVRRVERQAVALSKKQSVPPIIIKYLNRLSDLFFVMARYLNNQAHIKETVWSGQKQK